MTFRILALLIAFVSSGFLNALQANTLNLAQARAEGVVLAEALSLGERGDWAGAEMVAGRSPDLVVRDIVLWRKLRAGAGSIAEYNTFTDRRSSWPGQAILAQVVLGDSADGSGAGRLSGTAAANWKRFGKLWRRGKLDDAEQF